MRRIAPAVPALLEVMVVGFDPDTDTWIVVEKGSMVSKDKSLRVKDKHLRMSEVAPEPDSNLSEPDQPIG